MDQKRILIIAGPNGAGKTTFAREYLPNEAACPVFINADLIAAGFSPFQPQLAAIKSARVMLEEIAAHAKRGDNFAFETTLSGRGYVNMIRRWKDSRYTVKLLFLSLPSAEETVLRVASRVKQGGHNVPEEVVRRRFDSGFRNFEGIYKHEVNYWRWYDNSADPPRLVAEGRNS